MSQNKPAYRATIYAPYSVDATETTVLTPFTPITGSAAHSDPFKVCSVPFISGGGWKPYLDAPEGRHGKLDPVSRNLDTGKFALRFFDPRTTAGGSNFVRWVSAFVGDGSGAGLLNGRKVFVEESLDFNQTTGVGTWAPFSTGRMTKVALDRSRQWLTSDLQDMSTDLDDTLFQRAPHPSATTAQGPQLLPLGLAKQWGPVAPVSSLAAKIDSVSTGADGTPVAAILFTYPMALSNMLLQDTLPLLTGTPATAALATHETTIRALVTWNSGANSGTYRVLSVGWKPRATYAGVSQAFATGALLTPLTSTEPGYNASLPIAGTAITVTIEAVKWKASKTLPVLVSDTHPVTLLRWVIDGYFGDLNLDGTPRRAMPRSNPTGTTGDPFYDLEQDLSFPLGRWHIGGTKKRREFIRDDICKQYGLAIDLDASGKVTVTDVRAEPAVVRAGGLPALTSADTIATQPPKWVHTREGAVSRVDCTLYADRVHPLTDLDYWSSSPPDIGPSLIEPGDPQQVNELNLTERALDANGKPITIDTTAFRGVLPGEVSAPDGTAGVVRPDRETQLRAEIAKVQEEFRRLFGTGPMTAEIPCRRTSVVALIRPGTYATVNVDELPNPETNRRGGTRLMLCTGRDERAGAITLSFLDCGRNTAATAPTITAALNANDPLHAIDVTLGVTSAGAVVEYAATLTSVGSAPPTYDPRWKVGLRRDTNGTSTLTGLPAGRRIWLRASTRPVASKGFQRPSAYTALGAPGYLDLSTITGPTAGAVSSITSSSAHLAWTNANTADEVDVFLTQSASAPADWTETYRVATLPAGSTQYDVSSLLAAVGSSYTWRARCRDSSGGVSAGTGTTFVTTATTVTAPTPGVPTVNSSGGLSVFDSLNAGVGFKQQKPPTGISLTLHPADPAYDLELQRTTDSGGAPNAGAWATIAATIPGASPRYFDTLPLTGAVYWYRCRETGLGATASDWTTAVSGTAQRYYGDTLAREARRRTDTLYQSDQTLQPGVAVQRDTGGPTTTFLSKGLRKGTCRHGDAITFTPAFAGTPIVHFGQMRADQTASAWSATISGVPGALARLGTAGADPTPLKVAVGLGPSGFTAQLLLVQKGTPTAHNGDFSGVAITTAGGTDVSAALGASAPATSDQYTIRIKGTVTAKTNSPGLICSNQVVVAIEREQASGGGYTEVWRTPSPYTATDIAGSVVTYTIDETVTVGVAGMTSTGTFRVKMISAVKSGFGVTTQSVRGKVNASDGAYGTTFYTATNQYASATPNADDFVEWYASEGS